jgi:hypothetical protein
VEFVERQFGLDDGSFVTVRFLKPVPDGNDFRCDFQIEWPNSKVSKHSFGVDSVQALLLAMQIAHIDLLASPQSKADQLKWLDNADLGLPLPLNMKADDFS